MDYLWYMLGYPATGAEEGMPIVPGDSPKIRAVKRVMKRPTVIMTEAGDEELLDDYSRPHPDFQMTFEAPDQDILLEVIQGLRKVTINGHKRRRKGPELGRAAFVPQVNHLAGAIVKLKPTTPIVHGPYGYAPNTVYHDICARRWEPDSPAAE